MTYTISYPENVSVEEQRRAYAIEHTGAYFAMSAVELEKFLKGPEVAEADDNTEALAARDRSHTTGWNGAIDAVLTQLREVHDIPRSSNLASSIEKLRKYT